MRLREGAQILGLRHCNHRDLGRILRLIFQHLVGKIMPPSASKVIFSLVAVLLKTSALETILSPSLVSSGRPDKMVGQQVLT